MTNAISCVATKCLAPLVTYLLLSFCLDYSFNPEESDAFVRTLVNYRILQPVRKYSSWKLLLENFTKILTHVLFSK